MDFMVSWYYGIMDGYIWFEAGWEVGGVLVPGAYRLILSMLEVV
jgi:hypothetical protein